MSIQPQAYENLIEKLFDDRLSGDELQQLNDALRQSPDARDHYWHLIMLEGYLSDLPGWIAGQQYATQLAFSETLEAFIETESNAEAELQAYPPVSDPLAVKQQITWQEVRMVGAFCIRSLVRQKAVWGAAAAMVCVVALVYATWLSESSSQPSPSPIADSIQGPAQVPLLPVEPLPIAVVLNHFESPTNASQNPIPVGTKLAQGHVVELHANNAMQLEYKSGVRVILQGPGTYELLGTTQIGMKHGRLTAVVPPLGKGFTVSTEQTDFIDHGTEFGVTLNEAGHGEVVVLDGLIEARQATAGVPLAQATSLLLGEGLGGSLVPGEALPKSVQALDQDQANRFKRNWDDVIYRPQVSGEITYAAEAPVSLEIGQANSTSPLLIPEQRGVILAEDLHLNSNLANRTITQKLGLSIDPSQDYVIAAGTKLNSFLIHFDIFEANLQGGVEREFKLRFEGRIVGIVDAHRNQFQTDELLGLASIQYPKEGALRGASDPPGHPNHDVIRVSNDLRTLMVKMRLTGMDQIRVLVENTDP